MAWQIVSSESGYVTASDSDTTLSLKQKPGLEISQCELAKCLRVVASLRYAAPTRLKNSTTLWIQLFKVKI